MTDAQLIRDFERRLLAAQAAIPAPKRQSHNANHWHRHHSPGLAIGKHEQEKFERHYAQHGVIVQHRPTRHGDVEPIIMNEKHKTAICEARGLKNYNA